MARPLNIGMTKKHPNLDTIFDNFRLWSRISPERIDISKIGENWFNHNPFHVGRKKTRWTLVHKQQRSSGAYWATQMVFSEDYISALRGCCPFKFLHVLEIDPGYLAHPHRRCARSFPPKKFNGENLKFGLKFRMCTPCNCGASGGISWNFFQTTCRETGVIMWVQLLKDPPLDFERAIKTSKFRLDFWQLWTLIANVSGTVPHIANLKSILSTTTSSTLGEKKLVNLVDPEMILDGTYALCCIHTCVSEPTTKNCIKIDPYYHRQKCSPGILVSSK